MRKLLRFAAVAGVFGLSLWGTSAQAARPACETLVNHYCTSGSVLCTWSDGEPGTCTCRTGKWVCW